MSVRKPIALPPDVMGRLERAYAELSAELTRTHFAYSFAATVAVIAVWYLYRLAVRNQPEIIILPRKGDAVVSYSPSPIRRMVEGDL